MVLNLVSCNLFVMFLSSGVAPIIDIISNTKEFVINLTTTDLAYATDWCGVKSGKNIDKFEYLRLTKENAEYVKCPMIKESPVNVECRVREIKKLGSHHMFIADVLSIHADNNYIDKNGAFDITKCNLISYANGKYFSLGKQVGKFGYSVKKKKKKKRTGLKIFVVILIILTKKDFYFIKDFLLLKT